MIGGFCLIIYGGPLALMITVSLFTNTVQLSIIHNKPFYIFFLFNMLIFVDIDCASEML